MKILLVSLQFEETATGGGGVHVKNICDHFLATGQHITVLSVHTEKTRRQIKSEEWQGDTSIQQRGNLTIVRLLIEKGISHPYVGDKNEELNRIEQFTRKALSWLKAGSKKFDIINLHGHHLIPGYLAQELRSIKIPIVSTVHALETTYISNKGESLARFKATDKLLARLKKWEAMGRFADIIILNSPTVASDFIMLLKGQKIDPGKYQDKIRLISSGCNRNFLMSNEEIKRKLARVPDQINLITFSRLDPSKGIEFAINGAREAAKLCPNKLHLTIAGIAESEEYLKHLYDLIKDPPANLCLKIRRMDKISSNAEKKEILDDKHIYILATLKEPFGMSLIEASARGNLLVSTDNTGPRYMMAGEKDILMDWGLITPYGALADITEDYQKTLPQNIGKAIAWTINNWDSCLGNTLGFNLKIREKWTWEGIARQYLEQFKLLIDTAH